MALASAASGASDERSPVPAPTAQEIARLSRPGHPRLLASAADFAALKQRVRSDAQLAEWHAALQEKARRILSEPPSKYEIPDGLRLLHTSRRVLDRMYTLAMVHQLDGDGRCVERAWSELEAAANFKDWNPRHFLDTAEMTHAFAIGYDWLYDRWTPRQRATLRTSMLEKGIKLANDIHSKNTWWAAARHNWNQVCNGGIGMGALALLDEEPETCATFLRGAVKSIQLPMAEFAPDGAWAEGPGYWAYATSYNVVFLAGLQSALGTDFGLSRMAGFAEAGSFPIYASGPTGLSFNYADAHAGVIRGPQMFWLARTFRNADYACYARRTASPHALDLLWFDRSLIESPAARLPLDKHFRNSEVAMFRSAWDDRDAVFIGFKAGDNKANHSHLDLGSFVLDALGERWAVDLGADDYNLPGYFGKQRWTYYRLRAEGHNTLVLNPGASPDQDPRAAAKIVKFVSKPERAFAIADLTAAYAPHACGVTRGIALLDRRQALVQDEVRTAQPAALWWFMHTPAEVTLHRDGRTATLALGKSQLTARILSPAEAAFTVMDAQPLAAGPQPARQADNRGVRKLAIRLDGVRDTRVAVLLTPAHKGAETALPVPKITPLGEW